jgi:hypothetical protein
MDKVATLDNVVVFGAAFVTLWALDCSNRAYKQRVAIRAEYQSMPERWRIAELAMEMRRVTYWRHFLDLLIMADWRKAYATELQRAAPQTFGLPRA